MGYSVLGIVIEPSQGHVVSRVAHLVSPPSENAFQSSSSPEDGFSFTSDLQCLCPFLIKGGVRLVWSLCPSYSRGSWFRSFSPQMPSGTDPRSSTLECPCSYLLWVTSYYPFLPMGPNPSPLSRSPEDMSVFLSSLNFWAELPLFKLLLQLEHALQVWRCEALGPSTVIPSGPVWGLYTPPQVYRGYPALYFPLIQPT